MSEDTIVQKPSLQTVFAEDPRYPGERTGSVRWGLGLLGLLG